jgi:hypothetical protein
MQAAEQGWLLLLQLLLLLLLCTGAVTLGLLH